MITRKWATSWPVTSTSNPLSPSSDLAKQQHWLERPMGSQSRPMGSRLRSMTNWWPKFIENSWINPRGDRTENKHSRKAYIALSFLNETAIYNHNLSFQQQRQQLNTRKEVGLLHWQHAEIRWNFPPFFTPHFFQFQSLNLALTWCLKDNYSWFLI